MESFLDGKVSLHRGDCREVIKTLADCSIDSCVTDPPYSLSSIVKRFGKEGAAPAKSDGPTGVYRRASSGFMGKRWDTGEVAFDPDFWAEVWRVLKPGSHLIAMCGTRTYHHLAMAIETAGFDVRDCIMWVYGSGFPKSHDVSKGIDRLHGAEREVVGHNPKWNASPKAMNVGGGERRAMPAYTAPATEAAIQWQGWGTALKPAAELCVLARKPLSESSIAQNVLKHGTGAINIDGCRVGIDSADPNHRPGQNQRDENPNSIFGAGNAKRGSLGTGRWPANLCHDGSEEVLSGFPETVSTPRTASPTHHTGKVTSFQRGSETSTFSDSGSAARFFYTAKADANDRLGSRHPTVKPTDLIQYLTRLITPRGGNILDPFAGTGTTGEAAFREGFRAVLIEREPEYQADIVKRMGLVLAGPDQRRAATVEQLPPEDLPMFSLTNKGAEA